MKLKKITSMLAIALTIAVGAITFEPSVVYAATGTSIQSQTSINANTKITKDNFRDVLKYVGLDPNNYTPDANVDKNKEVKTVGELQKAIENAKKIKGTVFTKKVPKSSDSNKLKSSVLPRYEGALSLSDTTQVGDSYKVTIYCTGEYDSDSKEWTGVSGLGASVDSAGTTIYSYKIAPDPDIRGKCTPDTITVNSYVTVNTYLAIESGVTCVGSQGVQGTETYDASDYYDEM